MTEKDVEKRILRIEAAAGMFVRLTEKRVENIEIDVEESISAFRERAGEEIGDIQLAIIPYANYLYKSAMYHICCVEFHASPAFISFLLAVYGIGKTIYKAAKWCYDVMHISLILKLHKIVYTLLPSYRVKVDRLFEHVSKFSDAIGWGADGLLATIQVARTFGQIAGEISGIKGLELDAAWINRSVEIVTKIQTDAGTYKRYPQRILDYIDYRWGHHDEYTATNWIGNITRLVDLGATKIQSLALDAKSFLSNLQDLKNSMPKYVLDNIPQSIWDDLDWAERQIDNNLLPKITTINKSITAIDGILEIRRKEAAKLADKMLRPGTMLLGVDDLPSYLRNIEEANVDDVASRKFARETSEQEKDDAGMWYGFAMMHEAMQTEVKPPSFAKLEPISKGAIVPQTDASRRTWFVGDY